MTRLSLLSILLCMVLNAFSQSSYTLKEGRGFPICAPCQAVLEKLPHEVLFGIDIEGNGDIYFTTNNVSYFHKIFNDDHMGISADLIARSRYSCDQPIVTNNVTNGFVLKPVYLDELLKHGDTIGNNFKTRIGKVPSQLRNELLEGNFIIVNSNSVCHYSSMINIEQDKLELLPTGLYTDTLLQQDFADDTDTAAVIFYAIKKTITLPFGKGVSTFQPADLKRLKDSLGNYSIRHLDIRAYSSVEGTEEANRQLMQQRAVAVQKAIAGIAPGTYTTNILPVENWIEFTNDAIPQMPQLAGLSKQVVKQRLQDKDILSRLEPVLAKQRKAVITVWLDGKTRLDTMANEALKPAFNKLMIEKNVADGRRILKEIAIRVSQGRLPEYYVHQLYVPTSPDFYTLESDQAIYDFYLGTTIETEALDILYKLQKDHPNDLHLLYNICVLEMVARKYDPYSEIDMTIVKTNINRLYKSGIHPSLITRLLINYNIIQSEIYMSQGDYKAKDEAVEYVWNEFQHLNMNDQSLYSLAKFFVTYGRMDLALATVMPRIEKLDASENIVFYFVNMGFFNSTFYENKYFTNAMLNAANLNRSRFCQFFQPNNSGGASIQLMESDILRKYKCENCPQ